MKIKFQSSQFFIFLFSILAVAAFSCNSTPSEPAKTVTATPENSPIEPAPAVSPVEISKTETPKPAAEPQNLAKKTDEKRVAAPKSAPSPTPEISKKSEIPTLPKPISEPEKLTPQPKPILNQNENDGSAAPTAAQNAAGVHEIWDEMLKKYVSPSGKVNYRAWKTDLPKLEIYLENLSKNVPQADQPRAEKMAFWLNVYNAATVHLILENYPISSITKLDGGKPWDAKRVALGSKKYSLNEIENEILRPQFKDPRIHFALNCAAKSCPPLLNMAFWPEDLEKQLDLLTRKFVQNQSFNQISENAATVSKIFEWYAIDFGDLKKFLNKYSKTKLSDGATVKFQEYDWGLNE